jgi:hypothetical protein
MRELIARQARLSQHLAGLILHRRREVASEEAGVWSKVVNPSAALATARFDELARGGVTKAVLSPGSRSAPPAFAPQRADAEGRLRESVADAPRS